MNSKKKILIVDDEPMNIELLEAMLALDDYDIISVDNGADAIAATQISAPDLILLDIMMPGMDGYQVTQKLKADPNTDHIPIVLVTALRDIDDRVRGLQAGADDFLTKPLDKSELRARINSLMKVKAYHDHLLNYQKELEDEVARRTKVLKQEFIRRKETEVQLIRAQKMEAIGTLAGGIAHDFNNILSAILGYAELSLVVAEKESTLRDYIQQIYTAGERAKDLVQQILTFSRQGGSQMRPVKIGVVVKEALKLLKSTLPTTITLRQKITSTSPVVADLTQVHQIIMNLATNAAHAMEEKGGLLNVELTDVDLPSEGNIQDRGFTPGGFVKLSISDTGHGMSPDLLERIFDPFFTTKPAGKGTGLGLSTVHGIVKSHKGSITVTSEPDRGTTFEIIFPAADKEIKVDATGGQDLPCGTECILFVDDEQAIANMSKEMLEKLGYRVIAQTSSADALTSFKNQSDTIDIVITDLTMPHMNGLELAQEFQRIRPDTPIILCSGHVAKLPVEKAKSLGIQAVVSKPVSGRAIAETIRGVLEGNAFESNSHDLGHHNA
jgi:CheY-like chemotaxis protein/nitrogen-specific signal transduction histidine kinase